MAYIEMINSCKTYHMGGSTIYANRDVSFSVEKGELAIILRRSYQLHRDDTKTLT